MNIPIIIVLNSKRILIYSLFSLFSPEPASLVVCVRIMVKKILMLPARFVIQRKTPTTGPLQVL